MKSVNCRGPEKERERDTQRERQPEGWRQRAEGRRVPAGLSPGVRWLEGGNRLNVMASSDSLGASVATETVRVGGASQLSPTCAGFRPPWVSDGPTLPPCGQRHRGTWIHGFSLGRPTSALCDTDWGN